MVTNFDEKIEKIAKKKQLLSRKQRLLMERERGQERKKRIKKSIEVGKLACKANIDLLDEKALLGAFLEISNQSKNLELIETWKNKAEQFLNSNKGEKTQSLCVSFAELPKAELKSKMKKMGFTWNKYRSEFYGKGTKEEIEKEFKSLKCKVEIIVGVLD